jgi:hypothetical protein
MDEKDGLKKIEAMAIILPNWGGIIIKSLFFYN